MKTKTNLSRVLSDVRAERRYQNKKWGESFDNKNTEEQWLAYISEYANGQGRAVDYNFRVRMIKTAALAVAAVEALDKKALKAAELSKKRDAAKASLNPVVDVSASEPETQVSEAAPAPPPVEEAKPAE